MKESNLREKAREAYEKLVRADEENTAKRAAERARITQKRVKDYLDIDAEILPDARVVAGGIEFHSWENSHDEGIGSTKGLSIILPCPKCGAPVGYKVWHLADIHKRLLENERGEVPYHHHCPSRKEDQGHPREWERVHSGTDRMPVPGGWIVKHSTATLDNNECISTSHALTFVPDPAHEWVLTDEGGDR
jgi:hypothetical protein